MASTTAPSPSGSDPRAATSPSSAPATSPSTQAGQQSPNLYLENNPARTGFDPKMQWWVNYFKILTGQVTNEGVFHYREQRYRANEERDVARCEGYRDWLFAYSPTVRFLNDKIAELNHGQGMTPANVLCRRCPARLTPGMQVERQSGGFEPAHGILVCANEVRNRGHLEDTLAHEMVHAYDQLRFEVDFRGERDLRQAACTEIRASMLSGECRWTREVLTRGNYTLTEQFQNCVRWRAVQSMMARPWVKTDVQAVKVVNEVWDSCFSDTRPFDEVYR
ncbi:hypothetical protein diail_7842 [Diaporthe ilicicola]|nr:hypothetical protein diail_7842 [Diaporthe ilicicola]